MRKTWRSGMAFLASWVLLIEGSASTAPGRAADPATEQRLKLQVERSLAYLQFWTPGSESSSEVGRYGTGFIVQGPDGTKWIVTSAHSLRPVNSTLRGESPKKIVSVTYRLTGKTGFGSCKTALVDEGHDLMALVPDSTLPLNVPALEMQFNDPSQRAPLYAVGSASALPAEIFEGRNSDEPITVSGLTELLMLPLSSFRPFTADLTFLRHNITIADGFSGCPIVTDQGKVVAVQSGTVKDAAFVCFAVHHKHLRGFNWKRKPTELRAVDFAGSSADQVIKHTSARPVVYNPKAVPSNSSTQVREPSPARIKLSGVEVEVPLLNHGYVERNARQLLEKYIQDKAWYLEEKYGAMRLLRLQELLDRTPLARISNPVLGFQMLVPKGYRYSAGTTTNPDGLLVTFDPPPERSVRKPYDWPLSIWVTVEPRLFASARDVFATKVKMGEIAPTEEEKRTPALFATFRDRYVKAVVADTVTLRFTRRDLRIPIKDETDKSRAKSASEPFQGFVAGAGAWLRSNFQTPSGSLSHLVRIGSREPLVLTLHYQYAKEDVLAFNRLDGQPDSTFLDYSILASTVSTK